MQIIEGTPEIWKPLNVGLMFFNYHPDKFFRYAWIEVVYIPDPTGTGMIEKTFKGPLNDQLVQALQYIENSMIAEKIIKLPDCAESIRVMNYPLRAVQELLSNAVFHKSYQIPEPVVVRVTRQELQITSCPGPERSITDDDIHKGTLRGRRYRNRRIGSFLKELGLIEGRNTGIPNAAHALHMNGSPPARYQTDSERSYFEVTLPIHPAFGMVSELVLDQTKVVKRRTRTEIESEIIDLLTAGEELSTNELAKKMGYKAISKTLSEVIAELVERGILEYSQPDQATSPKQALRRRQ